MSADAPQPAHPGREERLRVELEDAASRKWWARILYTLGSQYGRTQPWDLTFSRRNGS